jgi:signal recognition particle GTPase
MTDEELDNPDKVNGVARERLSQASGKPVDVVRSLIFAHKQTAVVHAWIQLK